MLGDEQDGDDTASQYFSRRRVLQGAASGVALTQLGAADAAAASNSDDTLVDILGTDPSAYPTVGLTVDVDSKAGRKGTLGKADFAVVENGKRRPITGFEFSKTTLDLVFVVEETGRKGRKIAAMKRKIKRLSEEIDASEIDARYALVSSGGSGDSDPSFTEDPMRLKNAVETLAVGNESEAPFGALETANGLGFRTDAQKVVVDITDAPGDGVSEQALSEVGTALQRNGVYYIGVSAGYDDPTASRKILAQKTDGLWIDIEEADFDRIRQRITKLLVKTYVLEYETPAPPGADRRVGVAVEDPERDGDRTAKAMRLPDEIDQSPPGFEELRTANLEMAEHLDEISQTLSERPRVERTLNELSTKIDQGDVDVDEAVSALERRLLGEDLTELSLGGVSPVSVSSPQDSVSNVGEPGTSPAAKGSFDVAGTAVQNALLLLIGFGFLSTGLKSMSAWIAKQIPRSEAAIDFLESAITTIFSLIPFVESELEKAHKSLSEEVKQIIDSGVGDELSEADKLYEAAAGKAQNRRDRVANRLMGGFESKFENDLETLDQNLTPDDDGEFGFEGGAVGATEAARTARDEIITELEDLKDDLNVVGFVGKVGDLMVLGGILVTAGGVSAPLGVGLQAIGTLFSLGMGFVSSVAAADRIFDVQGVHKRGLNNIVQGEI